MFQSKGKTININFMYTELCTILAAIHIKKPSLCNVFACCVTSVYIINISITHEHKLLGIRISYEVCFTQINYAVPNQIVPFTVIRPVL